MKKIVLVLIILLLISFIYFIPELFGYEWKSYDASIRDWENLSYILNSFILIPVTFITGVISIISLLFIYKSILLNKNTLIEMINQRNLSISPELMIESKLLEIYFLVNENKLMISDFENDDKETGSLFLEITNVGSDSALNININYFYNRNEINEIYNTIKSHTVDNSLIIKQKLFNKIVDHSFFIFDRFSNGIESQRLEGYKSNLFITYLNKSDISKILFVQPYLEVIKIITYYNTIAEKSVALEYPTMKIEIAYSNIIGENKINTFKILPSIDIQKEVSKEFLERFNIIKKEYEEIPKSKRDEMEFLWPGSSIPDEIKIEKIRIGNGTIIISKE